MNYALIEDDVVINLIWLYPGNTEDFPNAIPCGEYPVYIGDTYKDGLFYRDGEKVLTKEQYTQEYYGAIIAELDSALLDITYENIIGGLE